MVYRGTDDRPDFFCGWNLAGGAHYTPIWASSHEGSERSEAHRPSPTLFRFRVNAIREGQLIIRTTEDKRVEVMRIIGGAIWFDIAKLDV
jgi:hypothetical protein